MKRFAKVSVAMLLSLSFRAFAVPMTATVTLKERVPMQKLAANVLDPESERYQNYYTPEEIKSLVAPSDTEYKALIKKIQGEGFSIVFQSKSHLVLTIKGDHTQFERTFQTQFRFLTEEYYTTQTQAIVPSEWSIVQSVYGLDNTAKFKPLYKKISSVEGFDEQPGILPKQLKTTYNMDPIYDSGITGKGQHIAIATYMDFAIEDVREYYRLINLSPIPSIDKITFNGKPPYDVDSAGETTLDAELSGMIAPGASLHVFTSAQNSRNGEIALFTSILDDNRSKVVSYSWGLCERWVEDSHKPNMDKVFARAVAQGVNILAASGDSGSDSCDDNTTAALWPAIHPNVVAVGGTSLWLSRNSRREVAWVGSGGGVSSHYRLPSWQLDFRSPFVRRSYPDVSFNADPVTGEGIWVREQKNDSPSWVQVGGTSIAAPQWAGFLALVNEARKDQNSNAIGFLNPILYKASLNSKKAIFIDITSGKNGVYSATVGWDAVTGWGSMNGSPMFDFLVSN